MQRKLTYDINNERAVNMTGVTGQPNIHLEISIPDFVIAPEVGVNVTKELFDKVISDLEKALGN